MKDEELELYYQTRREYERKRALYFLIQRLVGILCIGISFLDATLLQDLTLGVVFVPLGLYLIFTRQKVMDF